jgi:hypothetical protein
MGRKAASTEGRSGEKNNFRSEKYHPGKKEPIRDINNTYSIIRLLNTGFDSRVHLKASEQSR